MTNLVYLNQEIHPILVKWKDTSLEANVSEKMEVEPATVVMV